MTEVRLACHAMATRFELLLRGRSEPSLRAAGEEAIREIERIESKLSFYRKTSLLSRLNRTAAEMPVDPGQELYAFLKKLTELSRITKSAFDPTIAPLMRVWGLTGEGGGAPKDHEIQKALGCTGVHHLRFDDSSRTVRFGQRGVLLDPGAVGKGYAIDRITELLRESGVEHALVHGGTSTVRAWGESPEGAGWTVAIRNPETETDAEEPPLGVFRLEDEALSVSTIMGKTVDTGDRKVGHILDPGTGYPVDRALLAVCTASSATVADACSTAMLVLASGSAEVMDSIPDIRHYALLLKDRTWLEYQKPEK